MTLMTPTGHRGLVAASDQVAAHLDELQFTLGEGPAFGAFTDGHPVLIDDLSDTTSARRWPAFTSAALEAGVGAVFAMPLQIGATGLGTMVLHHTEPSSLTPADLGQALRLADAGAYAMLDLEPTNAEESAFTGAEVHHASGILMSQLGVPIEVALARLRAYAFANGRSVSDVAHDVVARKLRFER